MSNSIESYKARLYQIGFGLGFLSLIVSTLMKAVQSGSSTGIWWLAFITVVGAMILALDKYYWVVGCFLTFIVSAPGFRASGQELGAAALVGMYFLRTIYHRETPPKTDFPVFGVLVPYLSWVALCFVMNPCGFYIFGSESIGIRFYSMLVIGIVELFVLSKMSFMEAQARVLFWTVLAGSCVFMLINSGVASGVVTGTVFDDTLHYGFLQMRVVVLLILCRYSLSDIVVKFRVLAGLLASCFLCVYSGNRTCATTPFIAAAILPFLRRRDRIATVITGCFVTSLLFLLAVGNGRIYTLPQGVQKSLSFLPGVWDSKWEKYGFKDEFRATLREIAHEQIRRHPLLGRKGFAIPLGELAWVTSGNDAYEGHALAGNWHNLWLGMAADFGIPCSVFFALFYFSALTFAYRKIRLFRQGTWLETMYLFMFFRFLLLFLESFGNGGHSAKTPFNAFLWFGFCLALINGRMAELRLGAQSKAISCH